MNKKQLIEEIASKLDDRDYRLILDLDDIEKLFQNRNVRQVDV